MKRVHRTMASIFVLAALLFSQWATASYACAMFWQPTVANASAATSSPCPDHDVGNRCEQHCNAAPAATDSAKLPCLPDVTDFSPLRLAAVPPAIVHVARAPWRDVPPDPPPILRFSVLRI